MNLKNIIISKLFMIDAIKKGDFTLKSGERSNYYFDMRLIMTYPNIYKLLISYALEKYSDLFENIDVICGIEFGGLPLANFISHDKNISQIIVRKEAKSYGTNKQIEGYYTQFSKLLLVEDVMTTGGSIIEKINQIGDKLIVSKILVILDRRLDTCNNILGYQLYSLFTFDDIEKYEYDYFFENDISNKIYKLSLKKQSNIILSCDLDTFEHVVNLVDNLHNKIVGIKLHINTLIDFDPKHVNKLVELKNKYELIIIEDGKFADIGNIVIKQLSSYNQIHKWADLITIHSVTGDGIIESVSNKFPHVGLLLIAELSTKNNLINDDYIKNTTNMYNNNKNKISGFICQNKIFNHVNKFDTLTFSPGINFNSKGDNHDQTYRNPLNGQTEQTGLYWIIGRGIYESNDVIDACEKYKEKGWEHFKKY